MTPATKMPPAPRRKSSSRMSKIVTLKLSPEALQKFPASTTKEESPSSSSKDSSTATSNTLPVATTSNGDAASESNSNTPAPSGTPGPTTMPPPTEVVKKKGVKRSSAVALGDGVPKIRNKPGPKKKARLEDGTIDPASHAPRANTGAAHKLGPKANQGAINAGLRALDRSGKPCRKWQRGGFEIKSFTGIYWKLPTWRAPPRITVEGNSEGSASGGSSKENKDASQLESEKSIPADAAELRSTSQPVESPPNAQSTASPAVPATVTA